jgi:salicylate hydroxylase
VSNNAYERVPDQRHHFARMHRALLQKELLNKLPTDILHPGKDVTGVQVSEDDATVFFKDKTSTTVDLVIGADGIRSVRDMFSPNANRKLWLFGERQG